MFIVFGFLLCVIVMFASDRVRVDMVGLLVMVLLPLSGVVIPGEAISGLSSNAVVSIIAVMIIGHGLDRTGVMNQVAARIIKLSGKSQTRMMALVAGTVAFLSSFMQNIGAASNTFVLPTHQVNALIMRPGGYRVIDYVRAGTGMTILFMAVVMFMLWGFYGISA
ncbi:MAG: hypothetical protein LC657_00140, partial [Desulfobacteraceae bacterium]|nr:hypothetical protein [Desulfobacteraceae bacterium]